MRFLFCVVGRRYRRQCVGLRCSDQGDIHIGKCSFSCITPIGQIVGKFSLS